MLLYNLISNEGIILQVGVGVYVYGSFLRVPARKDLNKPDCIPATMAPDNIVNITIEVAVENPSRYMF